ncbi:ferredoxin reductase [Luedemannella flava]|uniref:Ferredoxin reductase n=1 Tax=Luedemannella flava TaxID=349316 RepID=A0ABP4YGT6_9ACTN
MARAAVLGRLTWRPAELVSVRAETSAARTLTFDVPDWPGHVAGQHVDVRLTAADGYTAQRSYSLASAAGGPVELTVQRVDGGEVSGYLVDEMAPGDRCEVRGPVGGYFTWDPEDPSPVLLVAGGSGLVPLMSMLRTRAEAGSRVPFRLIYSVRSPADALYTSELRRRAREDRGLDVEYAYTRVAPTGVRRPAGRIDAALLGAAGWPADFAPTCYVCGPTGFVESVADLLVGAGHAADRVRTERFG